MVQAILFDMDGVLVKTAEVWFRLLHQAGVRFRGRPIERAEFEPTFGQGTAADVEVFGLRCTYEELDRYYQEQFLAQLEDIWVNPEAKTLLENLRGAKIPLAVVTNSSTELTRKV